MDGPWTSWNAGDPSYPHLYPCCLTLDSRHPPLEMPPDPKREALVQALRALPPVMEKKLETLKRYGEKQRVRDDFVWHHLLQSMATMGNSRGEEGLIKTSANYEQVTFDALAQVSDATREAHLGEVLRAAKVRMPAKKARWLAANFTRVREMGGPLAAKEKALAQTGRAAKIAFMRQFEGIGPKYARNIWMDVHHEDFRQSIAVDQRIKGISERLGRTFSGYREEERFYLDIATDAGRTGWEVDRLLYNFRSYFESVISSV